MKYFIFALQIIIMLVPGSCIYTANGQPDKSSLPVRLLHKGVYGGSKDLNPSALWVTEENQLQKIYHQLGKLTIGSVKKQFPAVDWSREGVLFVTMGTKPTGGYQLQLGQKNVIITNGFAFVKLVWVEPPAGAMLPQVITSPFVMIILPKTNYSRIHIIDQKGQKRLEVFLPKE